MLLTPSNGKQPPFIDGATIDQAHMSVKSLRDP